MFKFSMILKSKFNIFLDDKDKACEFFFKF